MKDRIRVLVVDDSLLFRSMLEKNLSNNPSIEVVAVAADAYEARDKIIEFVPDVMTLDINMPKMNGIEFTKKLMAQYPMPIVIVSSQAESEEAAFDSGAVYFVNKPKPNPDESTDEFIRKLILKIKMATNYTSDLNKKKALINQHKKHIDPGLEVIKNKKIIAIGSSTGGVDAVQKVLTSLPANMPPILISQHIPPKFSKMFAERINTSSHLNIKEAENGDEISPGNVYIAPGDKHLRIVNRRGKYYCEVNQDELVNNHRPSVDVLFDSFSRHVAGNSIGIILTGMGKDGAKGLLKMKNMGAFTMGQDEKSSVIYGMPKEAFDIGAVSKQLPLDKIGPYLVEYLKRIK